VSRVSVFRKRYAITPLHDTFSPVRKVGRKAVKKEVISVKLSSRLLETLDEYCEKVGLTRSEAIRLAIIQLVWGTAHERRGK